MAKKTFRIKDKQGNNVDYVIPASRVALDSNTDLDEKIGDIEDDIEEVDGSAVKKITFNGGTPKIPDEDGNVSLNQAKADWSERDSSSPKFIEHKPDIVEDVFYEEQTRTFKKNKNGTVSEIMTLPEQGSSGYEPPQGGIPKTDLATEVQESLNLADSSLQPSDKTQLQGAITQLQNALNTLIGSGNVQGAIDTFNEVVAFLNGIDTDDPTLFNQLKALSDAITALTTTLAGKANDNVVVKSISVNGGNAQTPTGGNVNINVPAGYTMDSAPTAGNTDHVVSSAGVKTALDEKADAATTYNKTEVDDAIDDKLTSVAVTEISDAADVIVINDADLAFIDEDGNIAMQVRGGHVETQNFDSRQVGTNAVAIQQLQSQIEGMDGGSGNSQLDVKNDVDAALDITDDNGNVVLRVTTEGHIQTKEFDSSEQGGGSSGQSGQDEMAYFLATKMVPQCICHGRDGFSSYRANTIPYYVKAYTQGFRFFETDVITCADGAIACHLNTNGYTVYQKSDPTQTAVAITKEGILQWSAATLASDYTWTPSTYTDGALTALGVPIATMQDVIKKVCHDFRCPLYMQVQDNNAGTRVAARNYARTLGVGLYLFTEVANLDAVTHSDKAGNHGFVMGSASGIQAKAQAYKTSDNNIIFCLTNSATNSIDRFTNAELKEFADTAHQYGCYCGCYTITNTDTDKAIAMRLFQAGFDFATTNGIPMSSL